jgi:hypothetical protein
LIKKVRNYLLYDKFLNPYLNPLADLLCRFPLTTFSKKNLALLVWEEIENEETVHKPKLKFIYRSLIPIGLGLVRV